MTETRTEKIEHFAASDKQTPQKITETVISHDVSNEQLAEEAEDKEVALIIDNTKDAGLKKVLLRLRKKGLLP